MEVGGDAVAQVLGLADVDDLAFGVLVEVHPGICRKRPDFLVEVHEGDITILDEPMRGAEWMMSGPRKALNRKGRKGTRRTQRQKLLTAEIVGDAPRTQGRELLRKTLFCARL